MAARGRPPKDTKPFADFSLLTSEEQQKLREDAAEQARAEAAEAARKAFIAHALEEERAKLHLTEAPEELVPVTIDLPGFADRITLDNHVLKQGQTVTVPLSQYRVIKEIMQKAWDHEEEIGGANRNFYRKPQHKALRQVAGGGIRVA